jgi:uncharacterized protein YyaL (SSP411 family)
VLDELRSSSGALSRRYRNGHVAHPGYLDDYAFFILGLLELYESSFDIRYFEEALAIQSKMIELFWDFDEGGFFYTPKDGEVLIVRDKEIYDGATPSGNSVAALNLMRLGRMTGNTQWEEKADQLMKAFSGIVKDYPMAHTQFLNGLDFAVGPSREIVIAEGTSIADAHLMVESIHKVFSPNSVLLYKRQGSGGELAAFSEYTGALHPVDGKATVYVCENYACQRPITDLEALHSVLPA